MGCEKTTNDAIKFSYQMEGRRQNYIPPTSSGDNQQLSIRVFGRRVNVLGRGVEKVIFIFAL